MPKKKKTATEMSDQEIANKVFPKTVKKQLDDIAHKDDDKPANQPSQS